MVSIDVSNQRKRLLVVVPLAVSVDRPRRGRREGWEGMKVKRGEVEAKMAGGERKVSTARVSFIR